MAASIPELPELRVTVDEVRYYPGLESPPEKPYPFVYLISIRNESKTPVTILARKWVVKEENGETTVVEGGGVVGQMPHIPPGGHFSYNSYHVVAEKAVAGGAFFGETETGGRFFTRIPQFRMTPPQR